MPLFTIEAETWAALNRLLDLALDIPESERLRWVESLGPEYDQLRPRLRDLLRRIDSSGAFLATLPKVEGEFTHTASRGGTQSLQPGDCVGPYRLLRKLGEGGMGLVWLVTRNDGMINRPVALKLPRGSWRMSLLAERMSRERDILAALTHPNIARLYDAGVTEDAQPYLAIEYVEGVPVDEYCRLAELDVHGRLRVFLQVLDAVAHAHSRLVVHRDLKPSNILVTNEGQVRLLDFGIAKLLEAGQAAETELTQIAGRALTPDYASPEQILGQPIGTASDVYSLGVVLYELLTGERPYKLARESHRALEDAILECEPALPSEAASNRSFRNVLRGELDWIVLRCLSKSWEERYGSAAAVRDELGRYMRNEPVEAGPPTTMYRLRKFVLRHRVGVGAAAVVLLTLIVGILGTVLGLFRAREAEAQARAEAASAGRVSEFLVNLFENAGPEEAKGREVTAREILERGAVKIRGSLQDEPLVRARLLRTIGYVYTNLGLYPQAGPLLDESVALARAVGEKGRQELGAILHVRANLQRLMGEVKQAEADYRASIGLLEQFPDYEGQDLGVALNGLAMVVRARNPEEALNLYRRTYDLILRTHGQANGDAGIVLANIGSLQIRVRRYDEARENLEKALPLVTQFHGGNDHRVGGIAGNLAIVHKELGNYERALELSHRDLDISTRVLGPQHPAIGAIWLNMARILTKIGQQEEALAQVEKALQIFGRFGPAHPLVITARNSRGQVLLRLGQPEGARAVWTELLALSPESVDGQKALLTTCLLLADLNRDSRQYEASVDLARRVLQDPLVAADPHLEAEAHWTLAYTLAQQGSRLEAESESRLALELQQKASTREAAVLFAQSRYYACAGDEKRTLDFLRQAVAKGFRDAVVLTDGAFANVQRSPEFAPIAAAVTAPRNELGKRDPKSTI